MGETRSSDDEMAWLIIHLHEEIRTFILTHPPEAPYSFEGETFYDQERYDEFFFYDWLVSVDGTPVGLELHTDDDSDWVQFLLECPIVDVSSGFPRIYLANQREGIPMVLEAFGDIDILSNDARDKWIVVVGLDCWLTPEAKRHVIESARMHRGKRD